MKNLLLGLVALSLSLGAAYAQVQAKHHATCTGSKTCRACKNCNSCKHCHKNGGTCGVCKPAPAPQAGQGSKARKVVAKEVKR